MGLWRITRFALPLMAVTFLINSTLGSCESADFPSSVTFLIAARNTIRKINAADHERGVEVTVFPDKYHRGLVDNRTYFIPDQSLPPECGALYFRCQGLLVKTFAPSGSRREMAAAFVPLENGMAIIELYMNANNILTWPIANRLLVDSPECSPTVIYETNSSLFMVCVNFTLHHIAVYEIHLYWNAEKQVIETATFEGPLPQLNVTNLSTSYLSNFVLEVSSQVHRVYFGVNDAIFVMDVMDQTKTKKYPPLDNCQRIHKLAAVDEDESTLLVYCSDRYFYYGIDYGDWTMMHTYSTSGIPYLCPYNTNKVAFFNDTKGGFLQFSTHDSIQISIHNTSITSGICFEVGNTTYFIWSDPQNNGVFVYDFDSRNLFPASPYENECHSAINCPELLLLENQFIIVRSSDIVFAIDSKNDFHLTVNVSLSIPDILTAVLVVKYQAGMTAGDSTTPPNNSPTLTWVSPFPANQTIHYTTYATTTSTLNQMAVSTTVSPILITYTTKSTTLSTKSFTHNVVWPHSKVSLFSSNVITYTPTLIPTESAVIISKSVSVSHSYIEPTKVSLFTSKMLPDSVGITYTVCPFINDNRSTMAPAPVIHNTILKAIIPIAVVIIMFLVVSFIAFVVYKVVKQRWYYTYRAPDRLRIRSIFTNSQPAPVPPKIPLTISDEEDDEQNLDEVENIEMAPLVEKNWPWKMITTV